MLIEEMEPGDLFIWADEPATSPYVKVRLQQYMSLDSLIEYIPVTGKEKNSKYYSRPNEEVTKVSIVEIEIEENKN